MNAQTVLSSISSDNALLAQRSLNLSNSTGSTSVIRTY